MQSFFSVSLLRLNLKSPHSDKYLQGDQVYIYKGDAHYTLVEGYPKTLKEELGIEGAVDAAFLCPNQHTVHILQGKLLSAYIFFGRGGGREKMVQTA